MTTPTQATVAVGATAPAGFRIEPATARPTVVSNGLPTAARVPFTVTVPAGTPEGEYPVQVTARIPGADPTTRTAAVVVRLGRCAAGATVAFCPVDLGRDYNHDGVATLDATDQRLRRQRLELRSRAAAAGGPRHDRRHALHAVDGGHRRQLRRGPRPVARAARGRMGDRLVLGATHNGNVDTAATVTYSDGGSESVPLQLTDWPGGAAFGNTKEIAMPYRIKAGQGQDGPPVAIFGARAALDPARTPRSIALPDDPRLEIYALTPGKADARGEGARHIRDDVPRPIP